MGKASAKEREEASSRRKAHMGWLMTCVVVEQAIRITPGNFSKKQLLSKGFPDVFHWPVFGDFEHGAMLIEAVMSHDIETIRNLNALQPNADLGLTPWMLKIESSNQKSASIDRKVLSSKKLPKGYVLEYVLETDLIDKTRRILRQVLSGTKVVAVEEMAKDTIPQEDTP